MPEPSPTPGSGRRRVPDRRLELRGAIASCGFASGDRFVVGAWEESPLGRITDVMWATSAGRRILLADSDATAAFVAAIYRFDEVRVVPVDRVGDDRSLEVTAGPLQLRMDAGSGWRLPFPHRPAWVTRWIEHPIALAALGVRTFGTTATGWREWYRADEIRFLDDAAAALDGRDLGAMAPVKPACGFGFSEPPRRPSIVRVRPLLHPPVP